MGRKLQRHNLKSVGKASVKLNDKQSSQTVSLAKALLFVCIVVTATHWPALSSQAVSWDDEEYLVGNPLIQNPSWFSAKRFITEVLEPSSVRGAYSPVTMISQMLDYALGGRVTNLRSFHRTSLILHVCNTALVIVLCYQLFGCVWPAAMAGMLFGIHPLTVGRITWVTERKTVLAAFFALWCLIIYVHYTHRRSWKVYGFCLSMYVLSLLSKPTSVPLPAVMLLLDYWPLRRFDRRAVLEKLPFFAIGTISFVISYISFSRTAPIITTGEIGVMRLAKILCHNIIFYLYKIFRPINLSLFYPFPKPLSLSNPMVLAGVIGTCLLIVLLVVSRRWTRALLTGWLIFFVAILPTMGLIGFSDVIVADRFVYLPSIGFLLILSWAFSRLWQSSKVSGRFRPQRIIVFLVAAILAVPEIICTRSYLAHWKDSESHFRYMQRLAPDSEKINQDLGLVLARQGKFDEAITYFSQALQLKPNFQKAHTSLGVMLAQRGDLDEAVFHLVKAVQLKPEDDAAQYNLGLVLEQKGEFEGAIIHYKESLRLKPDSPDTLNNLASILATNKKDELRDGVEAARLAKRACELTNYKDPDVLNTLAKAYAEVGNFTEAVETAQKAINLYLSSGMIRQAEEVSRQQQLYKAGQPYRAN
jgi:Flp pilus assembly protein TadD